MTYGYVSWFGVIVPYLKIVGLPLTTTWVVVYREGMTTTKTYERTVPRHRALTGPWASDTITIRVDDEGAWDDKDGPMERVGSIDCYGNGWGFTLYSRGGGERFATRDEARDALARAFGFSDA